MVLLKHRKQFGQETPQAKYVQATLKYPRLVVMWGLILLGYFLFVLQWYSIGNFAGGFGHTFFEGGRASVLEGSATNWTITLGRGIGSILAGYFIAKLGHKYSIIFVLTLMLLSFPYLIVAQNQSWNSLALINSPLTNTFEGTTTSVGGFSLFVIFRIFLGIGGTTLITYTNSVIAHMPANKKGSHITWNSLGFNLGAFFGNIFFVIPGLRSTITNTNAWIAILAVLLGFVFILLLIYLFVGLEVVPRKKTEFREAHKHIFGFKDAFRRRNLYFLYYFYAVWLVAVVFSNQAGFKSFLSQSPINTVTLVNYNIDHGTKITNLFAIPQYGYIFPLYVSIFVISYVVSIFTVANISKTIFNRKYYGGMLYAIGLFFLALAIFSGYFGGFANPFTNVLFFLFTFISGIFLWGNQPVTLTLPQQESDSSPRYVGVVAGLVWGIGYTFYTVSDATLSSISTYAIYANDMPYSHYVTKLTEAGKHIGLSNISATSVQHPGAYAMMVLFWVIVASSLIVIKFLPNTGFYNNKKQFVYFRKVFNPFKLSHYRWSDSEYSIKNNL